MTASSRMRIYSSVVSNPSGSVYCAVRAAPLNTTDPWTTAICTLLLSRHSSTNCTVPFPPCLAAQLTSLALFPKTTHRECCTVRAWHRSPRHDTCHPAGGTKLQVHIPLKVQSSEMLLGVDWQTLADVSKEHKVLIVRAT